MKAAMPDIFPIGNMVVIQRKLPSDTTKGGIVLPNAARETRAIGEVIAVGPGAFRSNRQPGETERYPMQVKVGDKVVFGPASFPLNLDLDDPDTEIIMCPEHQLFAILK